MVLKILSIFSKIDRTRFQYLYSKYFIIAGNTKLKLLQLSNRDIDSSIAWPEVGGLFTFFAKRIEREKERKYKNAMVKFLNF